MEQVQKQQQELKQSLDFVERKKDFVVQPPSDQPKRQFVFDSDDERIGKSKYETESVRNEETIKSVLRQKDDAIAKERTAVQDDLHVSPDSQHSPMKPPPKTPAVDPLLSDTGPETLVTSNTANSGSDSPTNRCISIKSLLQLVHRMQDTIEKQDALISRLQADTNKFRNALMRRENAIDPSVLRTRAAETATHTGGAISYPPSRGEPSQPEDISTIMKRQTDLLESVRRKHGWA